MLTLEDNALFLLEDGDGFLFEYEFVGHGGASLGGTASVGGFIEGQGGASLGGSATHTMVMNSDRPTGVVRVGGVARFKFKKANCRFALCDNDCLLLGRSSIVITYKVAEVNVPAITACHLQRANEAIYNKEYNKRKVFVPPVF